MLPPPITGLSVLDAAETDSGPESVKSNTSSKSDKLEPPHQLLSLVDALAQAKKEMELKSSRVHDLEEALKKERKAREEAEDRAAQLEIASRTTNDDSGELDNPNPDHDSDSADNDHWADDASITESETETIVGSVDSMISSTDVEAITKAAAEAALLHQKRMEAMMQELQQAKEKMEQFRIRAEKAETERDADRKTLAEMIQSLRKDEEERRRRSSSHSSQTDEAGTQAAAVQVALSSDEARLTKSNGTTVGPQQEYKKSNGALSVTPKALKAAERESALLVPRSDSAPYMTMFAVMFVGLGLMAAVNNWPRPDTR